MHREWGSALQRGGGRQRPALESTFSYLSGALKAEDLIHPKEPVGDHSELKQRKGCLPIRAVGMLPCAAGEPREEQVARWAGPWLWTPQ